MSLFFSECRHVLKSYIYYVFIAVILLFYISQVGNFTTADLQELLSPPVRLDDEVHPAPYGWKRSDPSRETINSAVTNLYREYSRNSYSTYPFGFHKNVKLNANEQEQVRVVLEELTDHSVSELDVFWIAREATWLPVNENITMERFSELMAKLDELLGGGSAYGREGLARISLVPKTYEEVVEEWEYMVHKDLITNGLARRFCDYLGIVLGIFPIFVAVFMAIKDRRTRMEQAVYSRQASSAKIVISRYFALVIMMILPVILLGLKETVVALYFGTSNSYPVDAFAFGRYIFWWLVPTLMFVTALAIFLTYLTDTPVAIVVGLVLWLFNLNSIRLTGDYPVWGLFVRHNSLLEANLILENYGAIWANRLTISGLALFFILTTVYVYTMKRGGRLDLVSTLRKPLGSSKGEL
ncbi:MAG: ABC transporter permease [Firmicutes bacterium]|nr:ABC transporter permease [Bacillota bacterium]